MLSTFPFHFLAAVAAKAPRKSLGASSSAGGATSPQGGKGGKDRCGGNPAFYHPAPEWQHKISNFFIKKVATKSKSAKNKTDKAKENVDPGSDEEEEEAGASSSSTPQR